MSIRADLLQRDVNLVRVADEVERNQIARFATPSAG